MKKHLITSAFIVAALLSTTAQNGQKWATGGNSTASGDIFGTTNTQPINFTTNNTLKMVLDANGNLRLVNFAGTGNRVVLTDVNGKLVVLPQGTINQFLAGDGTWQNLPAVPTQLWSTSGNNLFYATGNVGIGAAPNSAYKLDVAGDAHIQNNLYVGGGILISQKVEATNSLKTDTVHSATGSTKFTSNVVLKQQFQVDGSALFNGSIQANALNAGAVTTGAITVGGNLRNSTLASTGISKIYADQQGNLFKGPFVPAAWECVNGAPNWNIGGNNFNSNAFPGITSADIGTCDDADFILKSNGNPKIWLKNTGGNEYVGFGTANPQTKFHFSGGTVFMDNNVGIGTGAATPYRQLTVNGDCSFANYGPAGNGANALEILGNSQIPIRRGISLDSDPNGDMNFFINNYQSSQTSGVPEFRFKNGIQAIAGSPVATSYANAPDIMVLSAKGTLTLNVYGVPSTGATIYNCFDIFNVADNKSNFRVKSNGEAYARYMKVSVNAFPDYVFANNYKLPNLKEVEAYYKANKHLPELPTAIEVEANGLDLGQINTLLVKKVEELTIYAVEQNKTTQAQQALLVELQKQIEELKKQIEKK